MIFITKTNIRFLNKFEQGHRLNGPAIIQNGYMVWYENGKRIRHEGFVIIPYIYGINNSRPNLLVESSIENKKEK